MTDDLQPKPTIDQNELDQLLLLNGFLKEDHADSQRASLIEEIKDALLDSAKLSLKDWRALRDRLKEIERLIPHIDLIIELKSQGRRRPASESVIKPVADRVKATG